ncbi:MAG TPA: fimbrillin family protein, partial [Candidatus Coprenecus merdigallinarum]|nr:fimbrillin family protein [Candidatus Coprenecus merdigallinarum]
MKRFLLPAVAAAAVLTLGGCTKTETVNVSDANYIGFDNAYIGNPTKAVEEVTKANIDHFIVYGGYATETDLFDGTRVAPNANSEWTYSPLIPWVDEQNYKFAAYSPESLNLTAAPQFNYNEGGLTFTDVIVNNSTNQIDFVYDAADPVSSGTNVVRPKIAFAFGHMFSMIQFTIKSGFPEDVKLTISDIKFYGMNSKNTLENGVWSSSPSEALQENAPIVIAGTEEGQEVQATAEPVDYVNNCVVLPQEFGDNVIK